jgi:hypothetical protein
MQNITQTVSTRNQSTANYESKNLFIFDNRFVEGVFKNTSAGAYDLECGVLVARDLATTNGFIPVTSANLEDVIGISAYEGKTRLQANGTANINIGTKGTVEINSIVLPAGVTLSTVVGAKTLRDVLEGIGFHLNEGAVEMTDFDN